MEEKKESESTKMKKKYRSDWPEEVLNFLENLSSKGYRMLKKPISIEESSQVNFNYVGHPKEFYPNCKKFDYQFFYEEETEKIEGIVYFGECLQGPIGNVHGGALSTVLDAIMGTNVWASEDDAVTLNLNVNYKKFVKLGSFKRIISRIVKRERKKIFVESKLLDFSEGDSNIVHVEATSLYYKFTDKKGCLELEDYGFAFPIHKKNTE